MYIIGITGGTGAGKSTAVKALETLGAKALDCDVIYHELLSVNADIKAEISAQFSDVLTDGEIDRRKLSDIVWNDAHSLKKLNQITHKYVNDEVTRRIDAFKMQGVLTVAIDAIALIESGQGEKCNVIVGVVAPQEIRVLRIMDRDGLSRECALMRVNAQKPESFFRENCDYILENDCTTEAEFEGRCVEFFEELLRIGGE